MIHFFSLTKEELTELLVPISIFPMSRSAPLDAEVIQKKQRSRAKYRAQQIYHWVYQRYVSDWNQMTDLSKDLREWLAQNLVITPLNEKVNRTSIDGTQKLLWQTEDGKTIESVVIPAQDRLTACISSQVGCAMACKFCLTGVQGLDRHLLAHEIVAQVFALRKLASITNIVFMGMGEPLHNFENVTRACKILLDQDGLNFSKRKVTISTSGLVPAIRELGQTVDVSLAISLNATTDAIRSEIMPVNKKWNLASLMQVCREYPLGSHRRITFEYVLLKDVNDTLADAQRIIELTKGIPSKINIIPFNEHPGADYKRPSDETVRRFQEYLLDRNITATVRTSRGRDILAACGQLRSIFGTARGTEKHRDFAEVEA